MRLDAAQVLLPAKVLAVDLAQVSDEEGILVANVAGIRVNSLNTALQSLPSQLSGQRGAMIVGRTKSRFD